MKDVEKWKITLAGCKVKDALWISSIKKVMGLQLRNDSISPKVLSLG